MKKILIFTLFLILICTFLLPAAAVTPYGSVTEDTSQVKILIEAMLNDPALMPFSKWFVYRAGEYDYRCYFNIDDSSGGVYYVYSGVQSGYGITWQLKRYDDATVPDLSFTDYTVVGNLPYTLGSYLYRQHYFYFLISPVIIFSFYLLVYFIFHHRRNVI